MVGAAAIALAPLTFAPSASAQPTAVKPTFVLGSGSARFKVNGHTWLVSAADFGRSVEVEISTAHENDSWAFSSVPASDLTANVRTGDATFDTRSSLSPIAVLTMKFRPTSHKKAACEKGRATDYTGTITGSISVTANHKGLKFKSTHVSLKSSTLTIDYGCVSRTGPPACSAAVWTLGSTVEALGNAPAWPARRAYSIYLETFKAVTSRADFFLDVYQRAAKPVFDSKKKQLTVGVSGSGPVTGSAVITSSQPPSTDTQACVLNGKHYKESLRDYSGTYVSPKGSQIEAHSLVVGEVKLPSSGSGFFGVASFKSA